MAMNAMPANTVYDTKAAYDSPRDRNPDAFYNVAEQANDRMGDFLHSLSALTDQLCGNTPPTNESAGGLRSVPNGHFGSASDHCGQIMLKLEHANRLIERIRSAL